MSARPCCEFAAVPTPNWQGKLPQRNSALIGKHEKLTVGSYVGLLLMTHLSPWLSTRFRNHKAERAVMSRILHVHRLVFLLEHGLS